MATNQAAAGAPWLDIAWKEQGVREFEGRLSNPVIAAYFRDAGHPEVVSDETAWCAAFVGAVLRRAGYGNTRSLMARSYRDYGQGLAGPREGCIAVLRRGRDPSEGHVGFVVRWDAEFVWMLGGNQSDEVKVSAYRRSDVLAYRWPALPGEHVVAAPAIQPPATERHGATGSWLPAAGLAALAWGRIATASRTAWALVTTIVSLVLEVFDKAPVIKKTSDDVIDPLTSLLTTIGVTKPLAVVALGVTIYALTRHVDLKAWAIRVRDTLGHQVPDAHQKVQG